MNKDKLIEDAIKEEAYRVNRTERPVYGQGQYDMAYIILDRVQKIIQSEPEETCKYCKENKCWLCVSAGECKTVKHCRENNNSDYKPRQNYCHVCGRDLSQKAGE